MRKPFLTARWESLLFLNFECPAELLEPLVPEGTVLDLWDGTPLISLVGFMFRGIRVRGLPIPGHSSFEEVNLRFYVSRYEQDERRRAVVFIRELVPSPLVAWAARLTYNEPYIAVRMSHDVDLSPGHGGRVEYGWSHGGERFAISGHARGGARITSAGSEAEFVTEHYWGYTRQRDGRTLEYRVEHPSWAGWEIGPVPFVGDGTRLYGAPFGEVLRGPPRSAYLALGSGVAVFPGRPLPR